MKVGTLDQLVGLSDDLGKVDAYVEGVTRKCAAYMNDVLEDQKDKVTQIFFFYSENFSLQHAWYALNCVYPTIGPRESDCQRLRSGNLRDSFPVGHGQISYQAITEKFAGHHREAGTVEQRALFHLRFFFQKIRI